MVRVALLAALAGENLLLLGPPGTGKSLVARRVALAFGGARLFQVLLTRFSTPEELFGPVSLAALRDRDAYERKVEGYLPTAEIAFIDEVFKASSAILNTLLNVLNERVYQNGQDRMELPLFSLLAASNEVPADEGPDALADRFTLRVLVEPVDTDEGFLRLICGEQSAEVRGESLSLDDVRALRQARAAVRVSAGAQAVLLWLRRRLEARAATSVELANRLFVSDRRWRRAVELLRVAALIAGRDTVVAADCAILSFCLWNHPDDADVGAALVREALEQPDAHVPEALTEWRDQWTALLTRLRDQPGVAEALPGGYGLRAGERRWELSEADYEALRRFDPDVVARHGLLYEPARDAWRSVQRRPDGELSTRWGQDWSDVARLLRYGHGRDALELEEAPVSVVRRSQRGTRFGFGGQNTAQLTALTAGCSQAIDALDRAISELPGQESPFLSDADRAALAQGPARAKLLLLEARERLGSLTGAIAAGGRWASTEIEPG